mgnify:CR=1 FL=1
MLKQKLDRIHDYASLPAAFGRLCVETGVIRAGGRVENPAAFGRLCVETRFAGNTARV